MNTPHGSYTIEVEHNIVHMRYVGMFNAATASLYAEEAKDKIRQLPYDEFFILGDLRKFLGATPDAYAIVNKFNHWVNTQNLRAKALVISNQVVAEIARERISAVKQQNLQYFKGTEEAINWFYEIENRQKVG
ncbi:hypothetical protein [Aliiglaciecola lipolytica]|uniref:STAS/SEC14 domain-containing protein n=1 Tax=Aliiglaciecola lipolytica E3 TaxID=1127673 RepID=K6YD08_9ALTE|nr:hypothetical protein [Aliiglaciecola lipolytica]GAC14528.1 hypothetical protein GLIP_1900 [Aliiglaciecola lipolytica E3]